MQLQERIVVLAATATLAKDFVASFTGGPEANLRRFELLSLLTKPWVFHVFLPSFQICSYFSDPMMCLGPVAADQVVSAVEHTAGEKRLSGHPDDFLRMK